ncbi:MAG: hypothetical protein K4H23_02800 [Mollicutes bacterium PWAP]|nr:hypothetical protein [Mollicutes bacterium PWAP]
MKIHKQFLQLGVTLITIAPIAIVLSCSNSSSEEIHDDPITFDEFQEEGLWLEELKKNPQNYKEFYIPEGIINFRFSFHKGDLPYLIKLPSSIAPFVSGSGTRNFRAMNDIYEVRSDV